MSMKYFGIALSLISSLSFAETLVELEKKCFDAGNASFAVKTTEEVVVYGNENEPKVSFVKYNVKNNPTIENGYPDQSFFMVNLPKSILNKLGITSWNEYLCGTFLNYAYPNVNELTYFSTKEGNTSVTFKEKFYGFYQKLNKYKYDGVLTPEIIDSLNISIPGNVFYTNYPLSRIYPNDFVSNYDRQLFLNNQLLIKTIDPLFDIFLKKDSESRDSLVNELKQSNGILLKTVDSISSILNDFEDRVGINENTGIYLKVYSFLKTLNDKLEQTKPHMTVASSAYANEIIQFFQDFDKQSKRYQKNLKKSKNKTTEQKLAIFSTQTLINAIDLVEKCTKGLSSTTNKTELQIVDVLSDYSTKLTEYLEKIKSGNMGTANIVKPALAKYIVEINYFLDLVPCKYMNRNIEAKDVDADVISLDDGTDLMLFGEQDTRILIRTTSSNISSLYFDKNMRFVGGTVGSDILFYKDFLPSIQIIYIGNPLSNNTFKGKVNLYNESKYFENSDLSSEKGVAYRDKLECIYIAVKGNMKEFKELVGAKVFKRGNLRYSIQNDEFQSLSCKDGVIKKTSEKR